MEKFKSALLDFGSPWVRRPMAAKWSGDEMFYFWAMQFYTMLDKIVTNLEDRYENKESSVIYDMASIIDDKSVADQVVQRVVRYCVLQNGCGSDVQCAQSCRCSISLSYTLK